MAEKFLFNEDNARKLHEYLIDKIQDGKKIILVNIGTDKNIADSYGPILGEFIKKKKYKNIISYGHMDDLITAVNVNEKTKEIKEKHKDDFIIAIDSCITSDEKFLNKIFYSFESIKPGAGVNKVLEPIGDMSIKYGIYSVWENNNRIGDIFNVCYKIINFLNNLDTSIELCREIS